MIDPVLKDERISHLAEDYLERKQRGESISLQGFLQDYPDLAEEVADYIQLLELMDGTRPSWTARQNIEARERIGDFSLIRLIGQGGMGLVFEAIQESLGRKVALKLMKQTSRDPSILARFTREARAAARLHHTNIVAVYGVGIDQNEHYLALQYVPGISLDRLLHQLRINDSGSTLKLKKIGSTVEGPVTPLPGIPLPDAKISDQLVGEKIIEEWMNLRLHHPARYFERMSNLIADIANALEHAHAHGVLHRDIKPSNLLLDADGIIWITDFGLARIREEEDLTQSGQLVGTLRYMAPERLRKQEDRRSDQYSLAATLYELLTLKPVYDAPTSQELLLMLSQHEPIPPSRHTPSIPHDLQTVIMKALSRDPDRRYASLAEFGDDLRRFVKGQPIRARRQGPIGVAYRWARRNPLVAGLTAAIFVTLLAGMIVSTIFYLNADRDRIAAGISETKANKAAEEARKSREATEKINQFFLHEVLEQASPNKKGRNVTLLEALQHASGTVPKIFATEPVLQAAIHSYLGDLYRLIGQTPDAVEQLQKALQLQEKELGSFDLKTLNSMQTLIVTQIDQGKLKEAEPLLKKLLPIYEKQAGVHHPDTIQIRSNLAVVLEKLGNFKEAVPLQRLAYLHAQETLGPDDDVTLTSQNNLGLLLVKANLFDEAFKLLEELVERLRERFPADHHRVLTARTNLLTLAFQKQDYKRALPQAREILQAQRNATGDTDPQTLLYMNNLGTVLTHIDNNEAEKVLLETIDKMEQHLDVHHLHRLSAYNNLGSNYLSMKQFDSAEPWLLKSLYGRRAVLPERHPDRLGTVVFLGRAKQGQKQYEAAIKYFEEALLQQKKVHERDAAMLMARRCNAECLIELGKPKEAEDLLLDNIARYKDSPTSTAKELKNSREVLAKLYEKQGKTVEAQALRK